MQKLLRSADVAEIIGVNVRKATEMMAEMNRINIGTHAKPMYAVQECDLQLWLDCRRQRPVMAEKRSNIQYIQKRRLGSA